MIKLVLTFIYVFFFLLFSTVEILYAKIVGKKDKARKDQIAFKVIRRAFRSVLWIDGVKTEVRGAENLPKAGEPVLYVSNHRSYFDIITTYPVLPGPTGYVAKDVLKKVPIFSIWMDYIGCLFLNRDDVRAGLQMILDGVERLKSGSQSIWICPEGTRSKNPDITELAEFKAGSFKLAEKSGVPIIPVAISGTDLVWEAHSPWIRSAHVIIEFGTPINTKELDREAKRTLAADTQEIVRQMLVKQKAERETPGWK